MSRLSGWNSLQRLLAKTAREPRSYDVAIIGAGLAGLRAAVELGAYNIIVLEKQERAGGRVLTRTHETLHYDLGAVLAYEPGLLPFSFTPSSMVFEHGPIGCAYGKQVVFGKSVRACIDALSLEPGEAEALHRFEAQPDREHLARLSPPLQRLVNAFFRNIHFGNVADYLPARYKDAFTRFEVARHVHGNGELADALARKLGDRLKLGACVTELRDIGNTNIEIIYEQGGSAHRITAQAAIVATTGTTAARLLSSINESSRSFLDSLTYTSGIVVAVGMREPVADFSYLVTSDLAASLVLKYAKDGDVTVLLAYYPSDRYASLSGRTDQQLVDDTIGVLASLGIGITDRSTPVFADVQRWPEIGMVITEQSCMRWNDACTRPSKRTFLAGDYTYIDSANPLPYGMGAAMQSGVRAARAAKRLLDADALAARYGKEFLTDVTIYEMRADRPIIRWKTQECTVAFYGTLLEAAPDDQALRDYLLHCAVNSLWEYQPGFGITPEDSALVMNGLLAAGVDRGRLMESATRLVELYFEPNAGAFTSLSRHREGNEWMAQGRARYWEGPSIEATAMVGYLLARIAPDHFRQEIAACQAFLAGQQHERGFWQGRWFPSELVDTYYTTRLLAGDTARYQHSLDRVCAYLRATQRKDGDWFGSVIDTAAAIRTLAVLDHAPEARARAKAWLQRRKGAEGWPGEPVLYYWFDSDQGNKIFYHCADKGKITTAWAELALAS